MHIASQHHLDLCMTPHKELCSVNSYPYSVSLYGLYRLPYARGLCQTLAKAPLPHAPRSMWPLTRRESRAMLSLTCSRAGKRLLLVEQLTL